MHALQLSEDGTTVVNVIVVADGADPTDFGAIAAPHEAIGIGWTLSGDEWLAPVVTMTADQMRAALAAAVQAHVQATARARGYDSAEACASYVASTVPAWVAEATAFVAWRDAVWTQALERLAAVEAGESSIPTAEALIASLPAIDWGG